MSLCALTGRVELVCIFHPLFQVDSHRLENDIGTTLNLSGIFVQCEFTCERQLVVYVYELPMMCLLPPHGVAPPSLFLFTLPTVLYLLHKFATRTMWQLARSML